MQVQRRFRKKFRALALNVHPDHNSSHSAEEEFILLTDALDMLLGKTYANDSKTLKRRGVLKKIDLNVQRRRE